MAYCKLAFNPYFLSCNKEKSMTIDIVRIKLRGAFSQGSKLLADYIDSGIISYPESTDLRLLNNFLYPREAI